MSNIQDSTDIISITEKVNTLWKTYNNLINTKPSGTSFSETLPFENFVIQNELFNKNIPISFEILNDISLDILDDSNVIVTTINISNSTYPYNLTIEKLDTIFNDNSINEGLKCNFTLLGYPYLEYYYKKECYPTILNGGNSNKQIYTWFIPDPSNGNISFPTTKNLLKNTIPNKFDPYNNTYQYRLYYKNSSNNFQKINFASYPDFAYLDNKSGFLYFYGGQRTGNDVTLTKFEVQSGQDSGKSPPYLSYIRYNGNTGFENLTMNGLINIDGSLNINNDLSFIDISNNLYNVLNTKQITEYINSLNISGGSGGSGGSGLTLDQILKSNNDASLNSLDISGILKGTSGTYSNNQLALGSHIIPISNADYDLGNAEYKIRHLFLSDNSIWIGDKHKIDISNKNIFLKKRNNSVPQALINYPGYSESALITNAKSRDPSINNINQLLLEDYINYALTLDSSLDIQTIYDQNASNWENNIDLVGKLDVSLNNFITRNDLDNSLNNYITHSELDNSLSLYALDASLINLTGGLDASFTNLDVSNILSVDIISNKTHLNGISLESIKIKGRDITNINAIHAQNYYLGNTNVISGSRQANFRDIEMKNGSNVTTFLAYGDTGNIDIYGTLSVDTINDKTDGSGVNLESINITGGDITNVNSISAQNYKVGTRNIISAAAQANFRDIEMKNSSNVVTFLATGDTGDIDMCGTLFVNTIDEKTSGSGVTIDGILIKDTITAIDNSLVNLQTNIENINNNISNKYSFDISNINNIELLNTNSVVNVVNSRYIFNGSNTYDESKNYGLRIGSYVLKNVSSSHPIALLNNDISNLITYDGDVSKKYNKEVFGTTADAIYDFYYGDVSVNVLGDFGNVSVYCFYHGYMAGQNLLHYVSNYYTTTTNVIQDLSSLFFNTITPSKISSNILININADLYCSYALEERISVELWRDLSMLTQSNNLGSIIATGGLTIPFNLTYLDSPNNNSLTKYYLKYKLENNNSLQEMGIINIQNNLDYGSSNIILREI